MDQQVSENISPKPRARSRNIQVLRFGIVQTKKFFPSPNLEMAKVTFTAWKTKAQLLDVRSEFYPPAMYDGPDMRSHACATVEAWKLRGNVPHHVEATALLTDAILHDDGQRNSIFSIRATYSAAFCRYVV